MPEVYGFQVAMPYGGTLPNQVCVNVLHFEHSLGGLFGTDLDSFCDNIATAYDTFLGTGQGGNKMTIKAYRTEGPPPHDPQTTVVKNPAATPKNVSGPPQIAVCLSFKGGQRAWERGRVYLAPQLSTSFGSGGLAERPSGALMDTVNLLAQAFADAGGPDWSFGVLSKTHGFTKMAESWCDNSWDTQRRRKFDVTDRRTRTTGA